MSGDILFYQYDDTINHIIAGAGQREKIIKVHTVYTGKFLMGCAKAAIRKGMALIGAFESIIVLYPGQEVPTMGRNFFLVRLYIQCILAHPQIFWYLSWGFLLISSTYLMHISFPLLFVSAHFFHCILTWLCRHSC